MKSRLPPPENGHGHIVAKWVGRTSTSVIGKYDLVYVIGSGTASRIWVDALVYAVYVTNRLHHAGIDQVPYNVWTGRTASVARLRVFGAHVTVRRSGTRPTKLDPHFYTG